MKFNFEEILILIVAFLIGWFSRTILQNNFIEGAMDLTQKYHNMPRERVCKDDDNDDECQTKIQKDFIPGADTFEEFMSR